MTSCVNSLLCIAVAVGALFNAEATFHCYGGKPCVEIQCYGGPKSFPDDSENSCVEILCNQKGGNIYRPSWLPVKIPEWQPEIPECQPEIPEPQPEIPAQNAQLPIFYFYPMRQVTPWRQTCSKKQRPTMKPQAPVWDPQRTFTCSQQQHHHHHQQVSSLPDFQPNFQPAMIRPAQVERPSQPPFGRNIHYFLHLFDLSEANQFSVMPSQPAFMPHQGFPSQPIQSASYQQLPNMQHQPYFSPGPQQQQQFSEQPNILLPNQQLPIQQAHQMGWPHLVEPQFIPGSRPAMNTHTDCVCSK